MAKQKQGPIASAKNQKAGKLLSHVRRWLGFGYCMLVLVLFPLFVSPTNTYFSITEDKFSFFYIGTLLAFGLFMVALLQALAEGMRFNVSPKVIWRNTSITQKFVVLSVLLWIVSTVFSPLELSGRVEEIVTGTPWTGYEGRMNGLRTYIVYALGFFMVLWCGMHHRDWVFHGLAISCILLSAIGILQRWGFNPLSLYLPGVPRENYANFYTTIGNSNFVSGMLCLMISFCGSTFICEEDNIRWLHLAAVFSGVYLLLIIRVDSGLVGMASFLACFPLLCCNTPKRLGSGLFLVGIFALAAGVWRAAIPDGTPQGALQVSGGFGAITIACLAIAALLMAAGALLWNKSGKLHWSEKKMAAIIALVLILAIVAGVAVFVAVPFSEGAGFLYQAQQMLLHGNWDDSFGSYRVFIWKRIPPVVAENPLLGTGAASFLGAFQQYHYDEMFAPLDAGLISNLTVYDSAHNIYLDYAVEGGILGLAAYLGMLITLAVRAWRQRRHDYMIPVLMTVAICYCAQGFFSFMNVTITPLFWALLGLLELSVRDIERANAK